MAGLGGVSPQANIRPKMGEKADWILSCSGFAAGPGDDRHGDFARWSIGRSCVRAVERHEGTGQRFRLRRR